MKVRITTDIDVESGEFEVTVKNISHPGVGIDANVIRELWMKVFKQLSPRLRGGAHAALN
jgi:hypothetical protein